MKQKITIRLFLVTIGIVLFLLNQLNAQCNLSNLIKSQGYITGTIGGRAYQSVVGLELPVYGSIHGLTFSSPLTIKDVISSNVKTLPLDLMVYPNPFSDVIYIEAQSQLELDVSIYDIIGNEIKTPAGNKESIDLSHLKSGTYFVRFTSEGKSKTFGLIKI